MLSYLLYGLFITACLVLIVSVLLQPGKADAGSLFTSSVSSAAFGPRGTQTILSKITIGAAITFFLVALLLGFGLGGGQRSLMEGGVGAKPTPAASPAAPASSPAAPAQTDATPAAAPTQDGSAAPAASPAAPATPAASPASNASPAPK